MSIFHGYVTQRVILKSRKRNTTALKPAVEISEKWGSLRCARNLDDHLATTYWMPFGQKKSPANNCDEWT
jgi:hypothetical protein